MAESHHYYQFLLFTQKTSTADTSTAKTRACLGKGYWKKRKSYHIIQNLSKPDKEDFSKHSEKRRISFTLSDNTCIFHQIK